MNKILVEIYLPVNNKIYEVNIPRDMKIGHIRQLVCFLLSNLSDGHFKASDNTLLCDAKTGEILDVNMYADESKLVNGSQLMLI